jgi:hypothetical protein
VASCFRQYNETHFNMPVVFLFGLLYQRGYSQQAYDTGYVNKLNAKSRALIELVKAHAAKFSCYKRQYSGRLAKGRV